MCLSNAAVQMSAPHIYTTAALLTVTYMSKKKKKSLVSKCLQCKLQGIAWLCGRGCPCLRMCKEKRFNEKSDYSQYNINKGISGAPDAVLGCVLEKKNAKVHANLQHIKK